MYEHQRAMIPDTTHPVAATQFPITNSPASNRLLAESVIRLAVTKGGACIILLPKLFDNLYFCQYQNIVNFSLSCHIMGHHPPAMECNNPLLSKFCNLSMELGVVLPVSFTTPSQYTVAGDTLACTSQHAKVDLI